MNTLWAVFLKEWLSDVRNTKSFLLTVASYLLLIPFATILPYGLLFGTTINQLTQKLPVAVQNLESAPTLRQFQPKDLDLELVAVPDAEDAVKNKDFKIAIRLPADFEAQLQANQPMQVELLTSQGGMVDTNSSRVSSFLEAFHQDIVKARVQNQGMDVQTLEPFTVRSHEIVREKRFQSSYTGWLAILLLTAYGLGLGGSRAMGVSAGEKQNETMEVLLLSPANRTGLMLGKTLYVISYGVFGMMLSILGYLGAFIGAGLILVRGMNMKQAGQMMDNMQQGDLVRTDATLTFPSMENLLILLGLSALVIITFTVIQVVIGLWASSESQGGFMVTILSLFTSGSGLVFFVPDFSPPLWAYAIPIFSQVLLIPDLLANRFEGIPILLSVASTLLLLAGLLWFGSWLFRQDEITQHS